MANGLRISKRRQPSRRQGRRRREDILQIAGTPISSWDGKSSRREIRSSNVIRPSDFNIAEAKLRGPRLRYNMILVFCLTTLLLSLIGLYVYFYDTVSNQKSVEALGNEFIATTDVSSTSASEKTKVNLSNLPPIIDWKGLKSQNSDCVGWIRIPGTTVDYPVMHSDKRDFYLRRNFYKEYSINGSIFTDHENTRDMDEGHIVIYGHHMNMPVMFNNVSQYSDQDFYDAHRKAYFQDEKKTYVLKVVGTYVAQPTDWKTRKTIFDNENEFQSYFDEQIGKCNVTKSSDWKRKDKDKLFTLITCTFGGRARLVVECIVEDEYSNDQVKNVIAAAVKSKDVS